MKTNWWLKLYTIPTLKNYGKIFGAPLILSSVFDWDLLAILITGVLLMFHTNKIHKSSTFYKNLNFHKNHVPLKVLKKSYLKHLLVLGSAAFLCIFLLSCSTGLFSSGENSETLGVFPTLLYGTLAWGLLIFCELKSLVKKNEQTYYSTFNRWVIAICCSILCLFVLALLAGTLDSTAVLITFFFGLFLVSYKEELKYQFHQVRERKVWPFLKSAPLALSLSFGIVFGVGSFFTRDFAQSSLSASDKLDVLETWPGLVEKISLDEFFKLEKYAFQGQQMFLYEKVDKEELAHASPELFLNPAKPSLLYGYLKHAKPSQDKLSYIKEVMQRDQKKWLSQMNQESFTKLVSYVDKKFPKTSPHSFDAPKSKGVVEGVEREVANIQEIPEEAKAQE